MDMGENMGMVREIGGKNAGRLHDESHNGWMVKRSMEWVSGWTGWPDGLSKWICRTVG